MLVLLVLLVPHWLSLPFMIFTLLLLLLMMMFGMLFRLISSSEWSR